MQGAESNPVKILIKKKKKDPRRMGFSSKLFFFFFFEPVEFKVTEKRKEFGFQCSLSAFGSLANKFVKICFMMISMIYPFVHMCNSIIDHKSIFSINMVP